MHIRNKTTSPQSAGDAPRPASAAVPAAQRRLPALCHAAALRRASRQITRLYDSHLAANGLTISQRSVLSHVSRLPQPTVSELAEVCGLDRTAMGRAINPLMRDGLLTFKADATDARKRRIMLTAHGKQVLRQSDAPWQQAQQEFEQRFGAHQTQALRALLDALCASGFAQEDKDSGEH